MLPIDPDKVGLGILGILSTAGSWFLGRRRRNADETADIAQANASTSISDATSTLYQRLREEIDSLRNDLGNLRAELDTERRHSRQLELYVWQLQRLMTEKGIQVPPFLGDSPTTGGSPNGSTL